MKIILGIAPYTFDKTYPMDMNKSTGSAGINLIQGPTPCLGLLYIASSLKGDGHQVLYFEGAFHPYQRLRNMIEREEPDLIGLTISTPFWDSTRETIAEIRKEIPGLRIVVGGKHADLVQEKLLDECAELDFVSFGDGEIILRNLCNCIAGDGDYRKVHGIAYREGGLVRKNPPQGDIADIDEIDFPDYSLIESGKYAPSIGQYLRLPNMTMIGSRGCIYHCLFCTSSGNARVRSISNIMEEIELLVGKYGIRDVLFYDENLVGPSGRNADSERMDEFCSRLIEGGYDLSWSGNARPDHIEQMSDRLLRKMKKAGCWKILFGLESGVQKNLDAIHKEFTIEQSRAAVRRTAKAGIRPFCNFIFGIPGETYEEGLKTIEFACNLKGAEFVKFLTFTPFPGSVTYRNLDKYGTIVSPFSEMTINNLTFVPHSMTREQVLALYQAGIRTFYRRPRYILQRLLHLRSFEDLKQNVRGFRAFALSGKATHECSTRD